MLLTRRVVQAIVEHQRPTAGQNQRSRPAPKTGQAGSAELPRHHSAPPGGPRTAAKPDHLPDSSCRVSHSSSPSTTAKLPSQFQGSSHAEDRRERITLDSAATKTTGREEVDIVELECQRLRHGPPNGGKSRQSRVRRAEGRKEGGRYVGGQRTRTGYRLPAVVLASDTLDKHRSQKRSPPRRRREESAAVGQNTPSSAAYIFTVNSHQSFPGKRYSATPGETG